MAERHCLPLASRRGEYFLVAERPLSLDRLLWSLRIKWGHFAPLRLGENESSHSGGGSRKGAKTQRSQREDPGYGWTKFSKTINAGTGSIAADAAEEALSCLFHKDHHRWPKLKSPLRDEEQKEVNMLRIKIISTICLLFLTTLVFTSFGGPQTATNNNAKDAQGDNEQAMQALVNEVRQLRLAIQRSNLNAHHSQVIIERMRSQQQTVDRLADRLRWARDEASRFKMYLPLQQAEIQHRLKLI